MSDHITTDVLDRRRYACPPWCSAAADHPTEDKLLHDTIVAEGEGWTVHVKSSPGHLAFIELNASDEFSPAVARSVAAALVRAADVEEFELRP